jgi:FKBP-type peptidyl-prolyl cis-trans isomerase (trigger factor)
MRALLVVEAIGEKEELLVTNPDLETELMAIAARNQTTVEEVKEYYEQNNLGQQLAIEILEKKVRRFLRESADIQSPA